MVRKVCLDTDIFIDNLRGGERTEGIETELANAKIFTTSVNAFELLNRRNNREEMEETLRYFDVLPFGQDEAEEAASISRFLMEKGKPVDFRDIFMAAVVKTADAELLTFNKKDFENIEGLKLVDF